MGSVFNFDNFGNDPPSPVIVNDVEEGGGQPPENLLPSVYSLTFDEFQSTMDVTGCGKDYGSMNLEELLKNISNVEELNVVLGTDSDSTVLEENSIPASTSTGVGILQQEGSVNLPETLNLRTVDEIWKDMSNELTNGTSSSNGVYKQPSLGEITLEKFLFQAGVVKEDTLLSLNPTTTSPVFGFLPTNQTLQFQQQPDTTNYGLIGMVNNTLQPYNLPTNINGIRSSQGNFVTQEPQFMISGPIPNGMNFGFNGAPDMVEKSNGNGGFIPPVPYVFNENIKGKRSAGLEKVVERRQKRMIKSRESAARSRARKQAYTIDMESEVLKLKEENKLLRKKQVELLQMQNNQLEEMKNKKRQPIRRTMTSIW